MSSVALAYDNADRRSSLTLPNGIVIEYGYDSDSRLTGLTYKLGQNTLGTLTYTYSTPGQRTGMGGTWARTDLPAALTSAIYDSANQISQFGGTTFSYDGNGNLTSDGVRTYTWSARDQLMGISGPVTASFAYDGLARRRTKTVGGTTTQFLYDGLNPVQELAGGSPTANVLTGLGIDEFFTRADSVGARHYIDDALGSAVALSDGTGTVQTEYTYDPFGAFTTTGAATANAFAFTGRESDGTGLMYYRARFYDPRLQRFLSEDPAGLAGGLNGFAYVANDPISFVDPLGLKPSPDFGPGPGVRGSGPLGGGPGGGGPTGPPPPKPPPPPDCDWFEQFKKNWADTNKVAKEVISGPIRLSLGIAASGAARSTFNTITWWELARGVAAGAVNEGNVVALTGAAAWSTAAGAATAAIGLELGITAGSLADALVHCGF